MSIEALAGAPQRYALSGPTMGTRWSAIFFAPTNLPAAPIQSALQAAVDKVDNQMSTWKAQSHLMVLNRTPVGEWLSAPADLLSVVTLGLEIARASEGSFDMSVGAAVNAWGFGAAVSAPDQSQIDTLSGARANSEPVEIDAQGRRLRRLADIQIDLSGIAKGYGVDQLGKLLQSIGITDYLASIDGELLASGGKPGGGGWMIGLERPLRARRDLAHTFAVSDMAIATSGNYRHWHEHAGTIVSHTIDPRSGRPLNNSVASVTVTARTCAMADAWATALMVLGPESGPAKARALGLDALFAIHHDDDFIEIGVGGLTTLADTLPPGERL